MAAVRDDSKAMDLRSNGGAGLVMAMAVQGAAQGAAAGGASRQAIVAAVAAALRTAWALLAGVGSEEDAELAMREQAMELAMRQQVRGAQPGGAARARRIVGAHVDFGKDVEALRHALAQPQRAQRGGRCGPRVPAPPGPEEADVGDALSSPPPTPVAAALGATEAPSSSDGAALGHAPPSPLLGPSAAVGEEEADVESPFEGHADGVKLEGNTSLDIGQPDVDEREGTDEVIDAPEDQMSDEADERPLEGGSLGTSEVGAARSDGCQDVRGAEVQATEGPVEVVRRGGRRDAGLRCQTFAETEVVRGRRRAPPRAASVCVAARGKGAAAPRTWARASSADWHLVHLRGRPARGWRLDLAQAARLAEPMAPPPFASGPCWWKQDVDEVIAKVHGGPAAKGRLRSAGVDEKKVEGLFYERSDDCGALGIEGQAGNGGPEARVSLGRDGGGGGSQGHDGGDVESAAQPLAPSTRRQRRHRQRQEDEQAANDDDFVLPSIFARMELSMALRSGAAGAIDEAEARLRAAVDRLRQAEAEFDSKTALFEQRRETLQRALECQQQECQLRGAAG
ncbi:unnamed protein product, partial [Prorocentrum cordatum]